jgi:hypothetical protein
MFGLGGASAEATMPADQGKQNDGQGFWERALDISIEAAKRGYDFLIREGKPVAENLVRTAPQHYKSISASVKAFSKQAGIDFSGAAQGLESIKERKELLLQFWRLRTSLNVAMLVDPDLLRNVTGIDQLTLVTAIKDFDRVSAAINKRYPNLLPQLPPLNKPAT